MVKGICRRVVVVRSPDTRLFEQAVFLLREDVPAVSDEDLLAQACRVTEHYVRTGETKTPRRRRRDAGMLLLGALCTGLIWALIPLLR